MKLQNWKGKLIYQIERFTTNTVFRNQEGIFNSVGESILQKDSPIVSQVFYLRGCSQLYVMKLDRFANIFCKYFMKLARWKDKQAGKAFYVKFSKKTLQQSLLAKCTMYEKSATIARKK